MAFVSWLLLSLGFVAGWCARDSLALYARQLRTLERESRQRANADG